MSSVTSQIITQTVNQTLAVTSTTSNIPATVTATVTSNGGIFPTNIDFGSGGSELLVGNAENQSGLGTQLVICVSAGVIFFLSFCLLRTRLPVIFAPRANMKRHKPPELPTSFFGWIIPMLKIKNEDMLENVGLDAVLMLHFLSMGIKIFGVSSFFGIVILIPISMTSIISSDVKTIDRISITVVESGSAKLIAYLVFVYFITFVTFYFLKGAYNNYVYLRAKFLLNSSHNMSSKSVIVTGIPNDLATDEALSDYYENLGIGPVRSCYVVRTVHRLNKMIQMRAKALLNLEKAYAKYWENPCPIPGYDPDRILDDVNLYKRILQLADVNQSDETVSDEEPKMMTEKSGETFFKDLTESRKKKSNRPTIRTGLWGMFGKKVDAIEYYTKLFDDLDKTVMERRLSPNYELTSVGFVTFETMSSAVIASQIAINPKPFACRTAMAYEPKDVLWHSVSIRGRERIIREIIIWAITIVLVLLWFVPVVFLSSLVSIEMIERVAPSVAAHFKDNPILNNVITSFVPTILINIVTSVLPMIFDALGYFQGLRSRSAVAEATLSKYFFFLVFFTLVVFTLAGSSIRTILLSLAQDPASITTRLAQSLTTISPFFINYTILQGILMMPLNLLLLGALIIRGFNYFFCKTPREYAENTAPWALNYGMAYPAPLLVFVIVLEYSTISPLILLFGTFYFCMTYFVYKYQFLYVYFRPYEAAGRLWKMIIPRIVFGLLLFQLTMCGLFAIKSFYILSILCVPIMVATCIFKYVLDLAFSDNGKNMPMQLLRNNMDGDTVSEDEEEEDIRQGDGNPGTSSETIVKGDSANSGVAVNTIEMARKQAIRSKWKNAAINAVKLTAQPEAEEDAQLVRPRHVKLALDEDDYEATPNKFTDYRQPPMRLNPGLLDTGLKTYGNPLLVGVLPQLWLPVKKLADGEAAKSLPEGRRLSDGNVVKEFQNSGGVAQQLAELLRNIEEKRASPMGDSNNDLTTTGRPQMDGSGDLRREARETAHSDAASIVEGRNTRMNALRELFHRKSYKSSHLHPDEDHLTENDNTSSNTIDLEEKGKADDHGIPNERPRAEVAAAAWKKLHKTYYHHKRTKDAESSSSPQTVPDVEKTDSIDLTTLPEQENTFPQAKQVDDLTSIPLSDHQDDEK